MPPLVMKHFTPLRTQSEPSLRARVRSDDTSEPALGSVTQKAASFTSSGVPKHCGIQVMICSGVPLFMIPATPRPVPKIDRPMPASPQNSSSLTIPIVRPVGSAKNWAIDSQP